MAVPSYYTLGFETGADRRCSLSDTLEKMVFIHANTKLIDKIRDVCYEEPSASWELELEQGSEDAEADILTTLIRRQRLNKLNTANL